jgi:hypothetical protein
VCSPVFVGYAADEHDGQANYELGYAAGIAVGRIKHHYAFAGSFFKIYLVYTNSKAANRHKLFCGCQHGRRYLCLGANAQQMHIFDGFYQFIFGHGTGKLGYIAVAGIFKALYSAVAYILEKKDFDFVFRIAGSFAHDRGLVLQKEEWYKQKIPPLTCRRDFYKKIYYLFFA